MNPIALTLIELGAVIFVLGFLARLAGRISMSPIPLYLIGGLVFGAGGVVDLGGVREFAHLAGEIGVIILLLLLGLEYTAEEAHAMGMVNAVVPHAELERFALDWAARVNAKSPTGQRMVKFALNLIDDGLVGQQVFAGEATRLAYMTDEAEEGRNAFLEKRPPEWSRFPWHY